jgi:hypothetical protein
VLPCNGPNITLHWTRRKTRASERQALGHEMEGIVTLLSAVLIGCVLFMCSCANIETRRFAAINQTEGSIYFQVGGFNTSALTPEGAFPDHGSRMNGPKKDVHGKPNDRRFTLAFRNVRGPALDITRYRGYPSG